jgi:hypothetical protein
MDWKLGVDEQLLVHRGQISSFFGELCSGKVMKISHQRSRDSRGPNSRVTNNRLETALNPKQSGRIEALLPYRKSRE